MDGSNHGPSGGPIASSGVRARIGLISFLFPRCYVILFSTMRGYGSRWLRTLDLDVLLEIGLSSGSNDSISLSNSSSFAYSSTIRLRVHFMEASREHSPEYRARVIWLHLVHSVSEYYA